MPHMRRSVSTVLDREIGKEENQIRFAALIRLAPDRELTASRFATFAQLEIATVAKFLTATRKGIPPGSKKLESVYPLSRFQKPG